MQIAKKSLILVLVILLLWQVNENSRVEVRIPALIGQDTIISMPKRDRKSLEQFFYAMIIRDVGGYTLFGAKPMHMNIYFKPFTTSRWMFFLESIRPTNLRIYRGWKNWLKYQHLFAKSHFALWEEKNPFWERKYPNNPNVSIFFIDKHNLEKTISSYITDFQSVLNKEISAQQLVLEAKDKSFFNDVLKGHDGLIGTLFGFGRDNAWLFEERNKGNDTPLADLWDQSVYEFFINRPRLAWIYFGMGTSDISKVLSYPTFLADTTSLETIQLKQKFLETRDKIIDYYKDKDFLVATLSILVNGIP